MFFKKILWEERGFSQVSFSVLAMFFLLFICGLSIDMERLGLVQGNLVVACDSGSLSGAMTADVTESTTEVPVYDSNGNIIGVKEVDSWQAKIDSPEGAEDSALSAFSLNAANLTPARGVSFDNTSDWKGEVVGTDSYKVSARARVKTFFAGAVGLLTGNASFVNIPVSATGVARIVAKTQ